MLAKQKATLGEGCNYGKIDRYTYSMCSLTYPRCPGANEGMCELEEVNTYASESEHGSESTGSRSTEQARDEIEKK